MTRRVGGRHWGLCRSVVTGRFLVAVCRAAEVRGCVLVRLLARRGWRRRALPVFGGTLRRVTRVGWRRLVLGLGLRAGGTLRQVSGSTLRFGGVGAALGLGAACGAVGWYRVALRRVDLRWKFTSGANSTLSLLGSDGGTTVAGSGVGGLGSTTERGLGGVGLGCS